MSPAVPEDGVWQEQQAPSPSAWVAVRMTTSSPFEQAAARMPPPTPVKYQQQPQPQQHLLQQQQQLQHFAKPGRSRLAALLSCACCGSGPAVHHSTDIAVPSLGSLSSNKATATGKLELRYCKEQLARCQLALCAFSSCAVL